MKDERVKFSYCGGPMGNEKWRKLFSDDEWIWAHTLSKAMHDPEEKRVFWEGIVENKQKDFNYSVFTDFPRMTKEKKEIKKIGGEIIEMLKESNAKRQAEEKSYVPPRNKDLEEWGERFGQHVDAELKRAAEEAAKKREESA